MKKKERNRSKPVLQHLGKVALPKSNVKRRSAHTHKTRLKKSGSIIGNYGKVTRKST